MRFYSKIPGSRYVFSDGHEVMFAYGRFDLDEVSCPGEYQVTDENQNRFKNGRPRHEVYTEELMAIMGKNPLIFLPDALPQDTSLKGEVPVTGPTGRIYNTSASAMGNALSESELQAGERSLQGVNRQVSQEVDQPGTGMATAPGASTLDADILSARIAANAVPFGNDLSAQVGPGASKVAELRAQAAQRTAQVNEVKTQ